MVEVAAGIMMIALFLIIFALQRIEGKLEKQIERLEKIEKSASMQAKSLARLDELLTLITRLSVKVPEL
jgi:hypothetical protein